MSHLKIAIVYDWVTTKHGGAEKVLLALHQAFPEAVLYTSVYDGSQATWAQNWLVKTTWLQKIPLAVKHHRWLALVLPLAFESLDLTDFDIIISVTSNSAKGILTSPHQLHVCYVLTPPRYLYTHQTLYLSHALLRFLTQPLIHYLKWWDQAAAYRPDVMVALSNLVAQRITDTYHRAVDDILYPPVATSISIHSKPPSQPPQNYFLVVSRLVSYKRIDLAIKACLQMQHQLVIIGDGPQKTQLLALAQNQDHIHFLGQQTQETTAWYLEHCQALLMLGIEDFGIAAAEAVAAGRLVVVHQESGVAEILDSKNAVFLTDLRLESVIEACTAVMSKQYNREELRQSMHNYATTTFIKKMKAIVKKYWSAHTSERTL